MRSRWARLLPRGVVRFGGRGGVGRTPLVHRPEGSLVDASVAEPAVRQGRLWSQVASQGDRGRLLQPPGLGEGFPASFLPWMQTEGVSLVTVSRPTGNHFSDSSNSKGERKNVPRFCRRFKPVSGRVGSSGDAGGPRPPHCPPGGGVPRGRVSRGDSPPALTPASLLHSCAHGSGAVRSDLSSLVVAVGTGHPPSF